MKNIYIGTIIILAIVMLTFPLMASSEQTPQGTTSIIANTTPLDNTEGEKTIKVYISETKEVKVFNMEDYIFGVVAAEMPALYSDEALKAQAIAAYTYAIYKSNQNTLEDYDITDNFQTDQAFTSIEKAREKWGEDANIYEEKIRNAVRSVSGKKITYNGIPILSVYHAISSGKTESALDVWGGNYDYLVSVDSMGDKLSPNYLSIAEFSVDDLRTKLSSLAEFSGEAKDYFGEIVRTESGTVKTINLCGKATSGNSIRAALDLRSANFDVSFSSDKFVFTVRGYGHGIGMSQYGAHYMAMQGKTYEEILKHYYKGCEIK
ncbi:MAG: stage II sporulation protein D [Clostridia bacterium]|nr:stage II sporulation protein D [Clostridia bacterium]